MARILSILAALCVVLLGACGESRVCSSQSCPTGCCTSSGSCENGSSPLFCGTQGAACRSCDLGQSCGLGQCVGGTTSGGGAGGGGATGGGTGGASGGGTGGASGGGTGGASGGGTGGASGGGTGGASGGGTGGGATGGGGGLPDAGTPPIVIATFGTCGPSSPCAGNLAGTWFRTAVCVEPANPFATVCPTATLITYSGTSQARLDFIGQNLTRTFGPGNETSMVNWPVECLTAPFSTCSALQSLLSVSCPVAAAGRTGCDCTVSVMGSGGASTVTWTNNGGGLITLNESTPIEWSTCVMSGSPDTLRVDVGGALHTYQRR